MLSQMTVPPSLRYETATPLKLPTFPSVSWPRWCLEQTAPVAWRAPWVLHSHCVFWSPLKQLLFIHKKQTIPLIFSFLGQQVQTDQEMKLREIVRATFKWHHKLHKIRQKKPLNEYSHTTCTHHSHFNFSLKMMLF